MAVIKRRVKSFFQTLVFLSAFFLKLNLKSVHQNWVTQTQRVFPLVLAPAVVLTVLRTEQIHFVKG